MNQYAFCPLAFIPMRVEASERSEMCSQVLFGELMTVIETNEKWTHIELRFDGYRGFVDTKMLTFISEQEYRRLFQLPKYFVSRKLDFVKSEGEKIPVYMGSCFYQEGSNSFSVEGRVFSYDIPDLPSSIVETAKKMLHIAYLWGGKTPFALDCSGFTQLVYRTQGISILRDASQQAEMGEEVFFLESVKGGELAFFGDEENISHVGIMIDSSTIIHASGEVKIEKIDSEGIFSEKKGKHTHKLRFIRQIEG